MRQDFKAERRSDMTSVVSPDNIRFKLLDGRIKSGLMQAGKDLIEIQEKELWRSGGFQSMKEYCESIGRTYHWAWSKIKEVKSAALPAPEPEKPKVIVPKRKMPQDGPEKREIESTPPTIKVPSRAIPERKTAPKAYDGPVDFSDLPIPPEIQEFWNRNEEIQHLLSMVSKIRTTLQSAQEKGDPLFKMMDIDGTVSRLSMVYEEIKSAKSEYVCPKCNGVLFADCSNCKGRGTLSEFWWRLQPEEERRLREK